MLKNDQDPLTASEGPADGRRRPWFRPNQSGVGWRPSTWQGWLILAAGVAVVVVVVVMLRRGAL